MNLKQNREFRTFDALLVIVFIGLVGGVLSSVFQNSLPENKVQLAKFRAESLAHQIVDYAQMKENTSNLSSDRNPSSVGEQQEEGFALSETGTIGLDPWGQPYQYRLLMNEKNKLIGVAVWSVCNEEHESVTHQGCESNSQKTFSPQNSINAMVHFSKNEIGVVVQVHE